MQPASWASSDRKHGGGAGLPMGGTACCQSHPRLKDAKDTWSNQSTCLAVSTDAMSSNKIRMRLGTGGEYWYLYLPHGHVRKRNPQGGSGDGDRRKWVFPVPSCALFFRRQIGRDCEWFVSSCRLSVIGGLSVQISPICRMPTALFSIFSFAVMRLFPNWPHTCPLAHALGY